MPILRPEIAALAPYEVGRPIEEVVREHRVDPADVVRLTANESPEGPFPGVIDAAVDALALSNRYPDNDSLELTGALAAELGIARSNLMMGNGSVSLLAEMTAAVGGPGTNVVYAWPSFVMYRFAAIWAGSTVREIPLDAGHAHDLEAMGESIDETTRVVFVCNPNNPTGTITDADMIEDFINSVPAGVLVVVDEAYHDFVSNPSYRTAIPLAVDLPNVVVLRTFSKIYALAAHRVGYAVGRSETLTDLRKIQTPLTVSRVAQAAALASLGQPDEVARRAARNAAGRRYLSAALDERGLGQVASETNFIYFATPGDDSRRVSDEFTRLGVIIRPMSRGWVRVSVGSEIDNKRFVDALDRVLETGSG
ncbi:MAG: histidinol-phosphate transaminase [Actinobacteria bacterium]|nr:histidinol-phosphate transaminase [Actinomycetota bacterium]